MQEKSGKSSAKSTALFVAAIIAVLVLRQVLFADLPIYVRGSRTDDQLMMNMAAGLIGGNWLGDYAACTLMKGSFYPMFVAAIHTLGLPYIASLTALHSLACIFFVSQLRYLVRNRWLLLVLLAVLLFDPGTLACRSFQAVYRNALSAIQVLFMFGAVFGLWLDYGTSRIKDVARALLVGVVAWSFWNTREDAMWALPFLVVGLILVAAKAIGEFRSGHSAKRLVAGIVIVALPFAMMGVGNACIKHSNEEHYGAAIRLEGSDGVFAETLRTIYSVEDPQSYEKVSVSTDKIALLYEVSPALRSIKPALDEQLAYYSHAGRFQDRGEVEDGWFLWALRYAAFDAGVATTLPDSQAFYGQVRDEIEAALDAGTLRRRPTMPSALMSPWREGYAEKMLQTIPKALSDTVKFTTVKAVAAEDREIPEVVLAYSEEIVGGTAIRMDDTSSEAARRAAVSAERANAVIGVYQMLNPVVAIIAFAGFVIFVAICAVRKRSGHIAFILVLLGMALSVMVMLVGISYTHITAFSAIRHDYLCGAYPLVLAIIWLTLLYCMEETLRGRAQSRAHDSDALPQ